MKNRLHPTKSAQLGRMLAVLLCLLAVFPAVAAPGRKAPQKAPQKMVQGKAAQPAQKQRFVIKYTVIDKRKYLPLNSVAEYYKLAYRGNVKDKSAVLGTAASAVMTFKADSRNFTIKGIAAGLSYPIRLQKGVFYLELTDFNDFIDPIMRPASIPKRRIRTVMLDAGHGGSDVGAQGGGKNEKDLNLAMVKRVGAILIARGFMVQYTRTTDKTLTLNERSAAATRSKPDLFISIHCNSVDAKAAGTTSGIEVYVANSAGVPSYGGNTIGQDTPGAKFQSTNSYWAFLMQRSLLKATKATDRGVKRKQFFVICHSAMPSMLIETGFISNAPERKKLLTSSYQDKLAVAICDAVGEIEKALRPPHTTGPVPLKVAPTKKPNK